MCGTIQMAQAPGERDDLENAQPSSFGFESGDGSSNLFSEYFQALTNRPPGHGIDIVAKGYERGDFNLVLKLRAYRTDCEYDVVFVPLNVTEEIITRAGSDVSSGQSGTGIHAASDHQSVLRLSANPVECPNKVTVPSFVRLEPTKERVDIRWNPL
jgi:hypothetical protein